MTDHEDLIRELLALGSLTSDNAALSATATAIKERVAERGEWRDRAEAAERECHRLGFVVDAQVRRAEKAEAELKAARAALRTAESPSSEWDRRHAAAIAAARAEGGE